MLRRPDEEISMQRQLAVLVSVLCAMIGLPTVGFASEGLAIVHPSEWDYVVSVTPSENGTVYSVSSADGRELAAGLSEQELVEKYPELYAHAQSAEVDSRASSESPSLPLAITSF
jgi:hypothetical protein